MRFFVIAGLCLLLLSCSFSPNPSLTLSVEQARELLQNMEKNPKQLERPVIVLGGWRDPGLVVWWIESALKRVFGPDSVLGLSFGFATSFDDCREDLLMLVDRHFPSGDPRWTTSVDVVAFSMGGLVARYAAADHEGQRRLRVNRLFTIATPHRGASLAFLAFFDPLGRDMRAGSEFLQLLDRALETASYQIVSYTRLSDLVVGAVNTSPKGQGPLWVPARALEPSHLFSARDDRIRADILRRLRGEPSIFSDPPTPLPDK